MLLFCSTFAIHPYIHNLSGRESLLWKVFMWRLSNFYLKNGCSSSSYFKKPFYNKTDEHCYNIRIVPINRVHRGGLVIMSEKETDKTWHRREKKTKRGTDSENTGQGQRDRGYGRQKRTPTHTKSQGEERRGNDRTIERGRGRSNGGETEITRHQERQETERGHGWTGEGERRWQRDSTRQRDKQTDRQTY